MNKNCYMACDQQAIDQGRCDCINELHRSTLPKRAPRYVCNLGTEGGKIYSYRKTKTHEAETKEEFENRIKQINFYNLSFEIEETDWFPEMNRPYNENDE